MAAKEDVKLLGMLVSPFAIRVRMALNMKGVSHEYIEQDLFDKSELLLSSNPVHKKVPVLIHNGKSIAESQAIVEYIDEVFTATGPNILPVDPYERAVARFWTAYVDEKLFPAWRCIWRAVTEEERAEKINETLAVVGHLEEGFVKCARGKDFFGGNSIGYLDLAVGCNLSWFKALNCLYGVEVIDAAKTPLLAAWAKRFKDTETAKEVLPGADRTVEYARKRQAYQAAASAAAK